MPSLILENTNKTDSDRIVAGEKRLQYIYERYNISKGWYRTIEVIFRQCLMHERFNTSFAYENEKSIQFPLKNGLTTINDYLDKVQTGKNYGLHPLTLQKMDRIKSAEQAIKNDHAHVDKLKDFFLQLQKTNSAIRPDDVLAHLNELKIKANKAMEHRILNDEKHSLRKFIEITKKGEIVVAPKSFDFFKIYSLLMYCLMEPFFLNLNREQKTKRLQTYGINGYIAKKLEFEFGQRLGFKPRSSDVADKIADNQNEIKNYKSKLKTLGILELLPNQK
jgi:hypothetical protein